MQNSFLFGDIIPHLLRLLSPIGSLHKLSNQDWPAQWTRFFGVFSVQHRNGDKCGIFTMFNAYDATRGINRPPIVPG